MHKGSNFFTFSPTLIVCFFFSNSSYSLMTQLVKNPSTCSAGDPGLIPGLGRSAREGIGYPLQYSWASFVAQLAKNPPAMWKTWVWSLGWKIAWRRERLPTPVFWPREFHGVTESQIQLSDFHFYFLSHPSGCEVVFHCGFDLHFPNDSQGFPGGSNGKEAACNVGELGLIPGLGRSPGEGMGTHSSIFAWRICMDRGAWRAAVHGVAKSRILLSD